MTYCLVLIVVLLCYIFKVQVFKGMISFLLADRLAEHNSTFHFSMIFLVPSEVITSQISDEILPY